MVQWSSSAEEPAKKGAASKQQSKRAKASYRATEYRSGVKYRKVEIFHKKYKEKKADVLHHNQRLTYCAFGFVKGLPFS